MKLIYERSCEGHASSLLPACDVPVYDLPQNMKREKNAYLPEVS